MAPTRFRLRDLEGRDRLLAALLALALVAAPVRAALVELPRWTPQGDDALIELRARDVGTARTPLVGQPSTSGAYGSRGRHVAHPGPLGLYVLAPGVRLLGSTGGILLTTMLVTAASVLVAAWATFRQAGPRAATLAALLLSAAMWTAGGAGLVDPLSSNFGRFPLLASAVLVWALASGDLRLAPLAVATGSFAAQQHLSVLPVAAVLGATGGVAAVGAVVARARRHGSTAAVAALRWPAVAGVVGMVLWAPVLFQQLRGDPGNLSALSRYSGDGERVDLGYGNAVGQVLDALSVPPFVGRSGVQGWDVVEGPGLVGAGVALVTLVVVLGGGWRVRRRAPRLFALAALVAAVAVGGVVTGGNVPDSPEQGRLNFFHWAFALSVLVLLALAWLGVLALTPLLHGHLARGTRAPTARTSGGVARAAAPAVILGVLVIALLPLGLDRSSDRLPQAVEADVLGEFLDDIEADAALAAAEPVLALVDGNDEFVQLGDTVRVRLLVNGLSLRFGPDSVGFAHSDWLMDPCAARRALVIGMGVGRPREDIPGRRLAATAVAPEVDLSALRRLVTQADGEPVVLGPDLEGALDRLPGTLGELRGAVLAFGLGEDPTPILASRAYVDLLSEHPPTSPDLDHDDLVALGDSFPDAIEAVPVTHLSAHLLDREELRELRPDLTAGCPD